jgi:hypothetical protein
MLKMLPLKRMIKSGYHMEYTAVSLTERVRVGEREVTCIKMQGHMQTPISKTSVTYFHSNEVPGGVVAFTFRDPSSQVCECVSV